MLILFSGLWARHLWATGGIADNFGEEVLQRSLCPLLLARALVEAARPEAVRKEGREGGAGA